MEFAKTVLKLRTMKKTNSNFSSIALIGASTVLILFGVFSDVVSHGLSNMEEKLKPLSSSLDSIKRTFHSMDSTLTHMVDSIEKEKGLSNLMTNATFTSVTEKTVLPSFIDAHTFKISADSFLMPKGPIVIPDPPTFEEKMRQKFDKEMHDRELRKQILSTDQAGL